MTDRRVRTTRRALVASSLLASALFASCVPTLSQGPARAPRTTVPADFGEASEGDTSALVDWRAFFGDAHLVALIDTALTNNQELNIAVQETLIASNEVMARRGEYLPRLGLQAGAGLDRVAADTSQGRSDERNGLPSLMQNYSIGLYASWEVDIWSRLRNAADAAMYRWLATREGRNFTVTRLVAEIAGRYYELVALDRQLAIVRDNIELQQQALEMVRLQQQAAHVTMLAVRRFEAQLQGFQSREFEIRQRIVEAENQINFLAGRFPQHVERTTQSVLEIDPPAVHLGLPAQLLENRPDVRRAELELRAAQLDVSAARARFYPALRLDAGLGVQSFDARTLLSAPDSMLFNVFAGVMAPLLNRRGITAEYESANARQMQAVLGYERAILSAYVDVNTGINLVRNTSQSVALKTQQVASLAESVTISTQLFNSARAEYLEVLTTRRDSLEAQMDLVETKQRQLAATVTLYQALGGGWRARDAQNANAGVTR